MSYLQLLWSFLKIGALTFGGGYAMLPILQDEIIKRRQWLSDIEVMDYFMMSQCLPGVIAVGTSILIGKKIKGNLGGIIAALGVSLPSMVMMAAVTALVETTIDLPVVGYALAGIRVAVSVLVVNTVAQLLKTSIVDIKTFILFAVALAVALIFSFSPVIFVIVAAVAGIVLKLVAGGKAS